MAFTPYAGHSGRVRHAVGNTAIAGITSWKLDKKVEVVPTTNFESTADSNSIVWETYLAGLGSASGSCEGIFDGDTTNSEEIFVMGTTVTLDLLFHKTGPVGYIDLSAIITGFTPNHDLRGVGKFGVTFTITGAPAVAA